MDLPEQCQKGERRGVVAIEYGKNGYLVDQRRDRSRLLLRATRCDDIEVEGCRRVRLDLQDEMPPFPEIVLEFSFHHRAKQSAILLLLRRDIGKRCVRTLAKEIERCSHRQQLPFTLEVDF